MRMIPRHALWKIIFILALPATSFAQNNCLGIIISSAPVCDNGGTPGDPSDDTWTFTITVSKPPGVTGNTWFTNDPLGATGSYDVPTMLGPFPVDLDQIYFFAADQMNPDCISPTLSTGPPCFPTNCDIFPLGSLYTCTDNGTPNDPSDDTFTYNLIVVNPTGTSGWNADDPLGTSGTYGTTGMFGPYLQSTAPFSYTIYDNVDPDCNFTLSIVPFQCGPPCLLIDPGFGGIFCTDPGTPSDPTDDYWEFTLNPTGFTLGNTGYTIQVSNGSLDNNMGAYGSPTSFIWTNTSGTPGFGLIISSNNSVDCVTQIPVTLPPGGCPAVCAISPVVNTNSIICNDNGTPTDPSDDTYTFNATITGSATGASWTANDPNVSSGVYNVPQLFGPYPISAGPLSFTITDIIDPNCTGMIMVSPPATCSNQVPCSIFDAGLGNITCTDNGTPGFPDDDILEFDLNPTGTELGSSYTITSTLLTASPTSGNYGSITTVQLFDAGSLPGAIIPITITDDNDPNCSFTINVTNSAPCTSCVIDVVLDAYSCDDNGTPNDPTDDLFSVLAFVNGTGSSWSANDPNFTTGVHNTVFTFGPYLISNGILVFDVTDDNDPNCFVSVILTPPAPCSVPPPCNISDAGLININCSDNGTPLDDTDDSITFELNPNGTNLSSSYTLSSAAAGLTPTTGTYGSTTSFSFATGSAGGGDILLTITDDFDPTCSLTITITDPGSCSPQLPCSISASSNNIICDDNGTPTDPTDDTFTFDITVTGTNTGSGWTDGTATGNYGIATSFGPFPIAGGDINLNIQDQDDANCVTTITVNAPATCSNTCSISANSTNIICNDNGTPSNPTDDTFTFDITVTGANTGSGWTDGTITGNYGTATSFGPFPISGGNINLNIQDQDDPNCTTSITVNAPNSCSGACSISANSTNIICDDNGTPSDPTDDTFTFDITVIGTNTGSGWTDGTSSGIYGTATSFGPFPISGGNINLNIQDQDDPNCTTTITVNAPNSCSGTCSISANSTNIICNDNGTPSDPLDDTFTFDITVSGTNTGSGWTDGTITGNYGTATSFGPFPISGGNFNLNIQDQDDPNCTTNITVNAPNSCSGACSISANSTNIICDDNGTPSDPLDDTFTFDITVIGTNTGNGWTDGTSSGIYGTATSFGPFPIAIGNINLNIQDQDDPNCTTTITINAPNPCSGTCSISANSTNISCDDNGTPSDPLDDTFTFDITVAGTNTGSGWTDGTSSGIYGTATSFGPFPIASGNINLNIQDQDDPNCTTTITINAPNPCSGTCSISANSTNIICDDNGTPSDPADDTFTFDITVSGANTGSGWTDGTTSGIYGTATSFGPFPIAAGNINLNIQDQDDSNCATTITVNAPNSCSGTCSISVNSANIICDDNGTPSDPADDTFTFDITVTGTNTGSGWTDGTATGNYGTATNFGPYPIADGDINLNIQDQDNSSCITTTTVNAPIACSNLCTISASTSNVNCDENGTPADPSDDTFTFDITVTGTNAGSGWTDGTFAENYNTPINYGPFLISAGNINLSIEDQDDLNCTTSIIINPPNTCSNLCTISANSSNIICDDNGTPTDPSDDIFTFDITVTGMNTGSGWIDGTSTGNYGMLTSYGPFPISGGNINLNIQDQDDPNCQTTINISPPGACSNCTQTVDAGAPIVINCFQSNYQLTGSSSAPGNYEWSGPNFLFQGSLTATISEPGIYYFTTTFPNNCQVVDSVEVGIDTIAPIAFGGEDATLNCINDSVYLVGNLAANQTGQWTNALNQIISNNNEVLITQSGSYFYEIQNTLNGCISTADEVIVFQDDNPPQAIILADPANTLDCSILSINLFVNPENNVIYSWTGLGDVIFGNQIQIAQAGTYGLIALDTISGCTAEDQIEIDDLEDYPFINITPPNTITCDFPEIILDASASQSGIDIMYTWLDENLNPIPNATNNSLLVSTAGIYYLQLNDENNGCENIDSITVLADIDTPSIDAGASIELFCNESQAVLAANTNDDISLININWSAATGNVLLDGDGLNPTVDGSGYYYVEAEFINNGCTELDSVFITINTDVPEIAFLNIQDESCEFLENGQLIVDQIEGGAMPYNYTLDNADTNSSGVFDNLLPGNYALQIEDDNGCLLDTSIVISPGINLELDLPLSINIMQNDGTLLEGITNVDAADLSFIQWSPAEFVSCENCLATEVLATEDQNLLLTIIHENGCTAIANIRVLVSPDATVYIPNIFSPNDDGINDNFTIYANESVEEVASLIIVDRWGEIIFRNENFLPNDNNAGWDGIFSGRKMNPAVFVYHAEIILSDGSTKLFSGDLTLIR